MDKDLVGGAIGSVGKYDIAFKGGELVIEVDAGVAFGSAGLVVKVGAKAVLEALKVAVPNAIADEVISVVETALLGL